MAALFPFRALRPDPAAAALVAAVPYDVVNTDEARALAAGNPLSFLHVSRAEIDLPPGTSTYADAVYDRAVENFEALKRQAPLMVEAAPTLYVYRLQMGAHVQAGVAGCYSIDEYEADVIRRHERTRRDKEDDRTRHMLALRAQTGPVFLTYAASAAVATVVDRVMAAEPLFEFRAVDGVTHAIWRAEGSDTAALVAAFKSIPALYIADGHHRAASAARARRTLAEAGEPAGERDIFLGVAFPHDQVQVLAYNRIVKDLNGQSPGSLLDAIRSRMAVRAGVAPPSRSGEVAMFLAGQWHVITLGDARAGAVAAEALDVSRLQDELLTPLLGIGDIRTDPRIDFVGGGRGTEYLEQQVRSGAAAAAFAMHPVSVGDLMTVSDAGGIMPPKSTWFEPKLRDGLLSHII